MKESTLPIQKSRVPTSESITNQKSQKSINPMDSTTHQKNEIHSFIKGWSSNWNSILDFWTFHTSRNANLFKPYLSSVPQKNPYLN